MALREIVPGILTWPWFSERHGYDFNGYLLRHSEGNVAIDPVEPSEAVLDELAREGVKRIVLTNRNHFRAAAKLRERTGARVAVHPADAEFVKTNGVAPDDDLKYGDTIRISAGPPPQGGEIRMVSPDFVVVDARGKSPGEIALWDAARGILLVGDACVGKPPGALKLLPPKVIDDLPALQNSLRRLAALEPRIILVGDGACLLENAAAALHALVRSFET
jgi:glyoxylase-like metal-dependent hydrolase (beta-lactamase superfamily II)